MRLISVLRALSAVTVLAGLASPAVALTNDEIAMYTGADRQKILEEGAKKEGQVVWYCTMIVDTACRPMTAQFEKKYPFIKATYISSPSTEIMQRSLAEKRANRVQVDVMQANAAGSLKGTGLAQRFLTPESAAYDPAMFDKDHEWAAIWSLQNGLTWNTNRISAADAPKTWNDLLSPKLKGKLYWSSTTTSAPRMITHFRMWLGEEKGLEFIKKLREQDIRTVAGDAGSWVVGILSGEYGVFVGQPVYQIAPDKAKGAPVNGTNPDPAATRTSSMALLAGAPHPHAAMLFVDFILSAEGQSGLTRAGQSATRPGIEPLPENRWFSPAFLGVKEVVLNTEKEAEMHPKSQQIYHDMFQ